jgi:uncharacterized membrane protein (UPF0127 family)
MLKIKIKKNIFNTKVLTKKSEQIVGMMNKKFDSGFDAMLFLMGGNKQCFWMKNCIIPLDIIIIKNNVIVNIHHNCPPCEEEDCPTYCGNGNIVLEIEGGSCERMGIEAGDNVEYNF